MGYSDPGPRPRTARVLADELAALLSRSSLGSEPVVLVGASTAGFTVRLLASQYPELAAGLVLVDASHEEQRARLAAVGVDDSLPRWLLRAAPLLAALGVPRVIDLSVVTIPPGMPPNAQRQLRATRFRTSTFRTTADELLGMNDSMTEVRTGRRELTIPVIVLSRGRGSRGEQVEGVWRDLQRDHLSLSLSACQVIAERSGHGIPFEQPEAVIEAIRRMSDLIRSGTSPLSDDWCRED
jgi:pimeloyl-ACP methyl ester carboxylesterase